MRKYLFCITVIIFTAGFFTGCWNYSEINDKGLALGMAIDYDKEKDLLIQTIELGSPMIEAGQTKIETDFIKGEGKTYLDTSRNIISELSKKLLYSHTKIVIISEEIAKNKNKLVGLLDFLLRDAEPRDDIFLAISQNKTAGEIFEESNVVVEDITSFYIEQMFKNEDELSKYRGVPLWEFKDNLSAEGASACLPTLKLVPYKDKMLIEINGTGVFSGAELVGWLNESETKSFIFVIDEIKGGVIIIEKKDIPKDVDITLEIIKSKTKVKPELEGNQLIMKIDVKTNVNIAEVGGEENYIEEKKREEIKKDGEDKIKKQIESVVGKVQREYQSDIFGFGLMVEREMPDYWKEIKSDWKEHFMSLGIEVNVELNIKGSAIRSETIEVGD